MSTTESTKLASLRRSTAAKSLALAFTLVLATVAFAASPALAGEAHPIIEHTGFEADTFTNPNGIAIDESTGDVYVADIGTNTVYRFDANGKPVNFSAFGTYVKGSELTGTPAGSFSFPTSGYGTPAAIAVDNSKSSSDPSAGDLYVMDAGHGAIDKYSASGEYLNQITGFAPATGSAENELFGIAVDGHGELRVDLSPTPGKSGTLLGRSNSLAIDEFDDSSENHLVARQLNSNNAEEYGAGKPEGFQEAYGFAVGPTGDDYLLYQSCSCALKLGQQLAGLGIVDPPASGDIAVATDPATGHVYLDNQSSIVEWDTGAMNGSRRTGRGEPQSVGVRVEEFGSFTGSSSQGGIAVDGATGKIYVSNPGGKDVQVFGSDAPAVTTTAASGITKETATLNGTIDSRGAALSGCRFQYGVADEWGRGSYEHEASCTPSAAGIAAGAGPVAVSAGIGGLEVGLLYRFRLVAESAGGLRGESSGLLATLGTGAAGVKHFDVKFLNKDGTPDTQAGSHPYELVNDIEFASHYVRVESNADSQYAREPDGTLKDLALDFPPGMVGDPNATLTKCTLAEMGHTEIGLGNPGECPLESRIGSWNLEWSKHITFGPYEFNEPIYNLVPPRGVAVQLGVHFKSPDLFINNGVLAGGDYPVQATVTNAPPAAPVLVSRVTVFGDPAEVQAELQQRNLESKLKEPVPLPSFTPKAFLTLPTGCHGPLRSTISVDSWQNPGVFAGAEYVSANSAGSPVSLTGCSKLRFPPEISVAPDTTNASTSSGLTVKVQIPQKAVFNSGGLAESALRNTTVALPAGVAINPSGGGGLEACSEGLAGFQIGHGVNGSGFEEFNKAYEPGEKTPLFSSTALEELRPGVSLCPDGSKIGTVKIKTPLLEHELEGSVYLASQDANPFGSLLAMYLMVEDPISGSTVKLTGEVQLCKAAGQVIEGISCQGLGQIVTTFKNTPDIPFEDLELHFFGGERAPLATPTRCGTYTTQAVFTPWDGNGSETRTSSFKIEHGPGGGPCVYPGQALPFSPTVTGGATNIQAGAFSPLTVTMNRKDGEQNLKSIVAKLPPGLSGVLTGVELCPEPRANEGLCGENSKVGEATISVGVGNQPFTVTGGKFYLTGPYNGHGGCTVGQSGCAPFGLTFEVPAKAGPFDLRRNSANPAGENACDCVIVRGKIELDPLTSAITITTDPPGSPYSIPTSIEGIPLEIQHVNATTTRGNFQFNPTNCAKMALTGTVLLSEGGTSTITTPFQVTNCAALKFEPKFSVSTSGKTSKAKGASLTAKLTYPNVPQGTDADIAKVKVELPKQLPSRLTTLQKACTDKQFAANPAACPSESKIGYATVHTPLIPVPLAGPVIFVSHGGEAFPSLTMVLQGYGITIDLVGTTFISKSGVTSTTFKTVPDQPFSSFELTLPEGKYSALAANGNLCASTKTVTVKKKRTIRVKGHKKTVTRKVKQTQPATLSMPTEFVAQNGAVIHQTTPIRVTGCAKAKPAKKKAKRKAKKHGKKK
jgi:DNA-binding beta-propeller fold protein YncE